MAEFYADNGMLNDDSDAVLAAYWDATAARWTAMGEFYASQDMLVWQVADYMEAAECQKIRWLAMADYYTTHDMLTRPVEDM